MSIHASVSKRHQYRIPQAASGKCDLVAHTRALDVLGQRLEHLLGHPYCVGEQVQVLHRHRSVRGDKDVDVVDALLRYLDGE